MRRSINNHRFFTERDSFLDTEVLKHFISCMADGGECVRQRNRISISNSVFLEVVLFCCESVMDNGKGLILPVESKNCWPGTVRGNTNPKFYTVLVDQPPYQLRASLELDDRQVLILKRVSKKSLKLQQRRSVQFFVRSQRNGRFRTE